MDGTAITYRIVHEMARARLGFGTVILLCRAEKSRVTPLNEVSPVLRAILRAGTPGEMVARRAVVRRDVAAVLPPGRRSLECIG